MYKGLPYDSDKQLQHRTLFLQIQKFYNFLLHDQRFPGCYRSAQHETLVETDALNLELSEKFNHLIKNFKKCMRLKIIDSLIK